MKVEALIRRQPWPAGCREWRIPLPYANRFSDLNAQPDLRPIQAWCIRRDMDPEPFPYALRAWIPFEPPTDKLFNGIDRTMDTERLAGSRVKWRSSIDETIREAAMHVAMLSRRRHHQHAPLLLLPETGDKDKPSSYITGLGLVEAEYSTAISRGYIFTPGSWINMDGQFVCADPGANAVFAVESTRRSA